MTDLARSAALFWLERGVVPVRVGYRGKTPTAGEGWQMQRPTAAEVARWGECNLGVLLGSASVDLVDVDLDCSEAVALAPHFLPATWTYGRASKPRSHMLFRSIGVRTKQFRDHYGKVLLELRGDSQSGPGAQSVVPPSVHVSGEQISWDPDAADAATEPREIEGRELAVRCARLARAALLGRLGYSLDEARRVAEEYQPQVCAKPPRRSQVTGDAVERARHYIAKMPPSISGSGGHTALFLAACALVKGFALDEKMALEILEADFNPRCAPPWSLSDLAHKVAQAAERSEWKAGDLLGGRAA